MQHNEYFQQFRDRIVGHDLTVRTNNTDTPVVYADWTASGRLYQPIESFMSESIGQYVANTHTEATTTGTTMTHAYHQAQQMIKQHVNAGSDDVIICAGGGMTVVVNKFQRILGLKVPEKWRDRFEITDCEKPVVFVTHMEHHSNQTTWNECEVTIEVVQPDEKGLPDLGHLNELLEQYRDRPMKIGAFTSCSNVTGIMTPYRKMAAMMHRHGGVCFVDFAASAPYVDIDMHPEQDGVATDEYLDAIYFSPHKFLGGPGSSGVLIFNRKLYQIKCPDQPGGGTVTWTNPWGEQRYYDDIEIREDGGTPAFLQTMRAALAMRLKDTMTVKRIQEREHELSRFMMTHLSANPRINILEAQQSDRLCIFSFYVIDIHFNLIVRLLNDRFGIQSRGGCSCAGTYGHILLGVDEITSHNITEKIDAGDLSDKPGWVRVSLHPTTTDDEAQFIVDAINQVIDHAAEWIADYEFDRCTGDFKPVNGTTDMLTLDAFDPLDRPVDNEQADPVMRLG